MSSKWHLPLLAFGVLFLSGCDPWTESYAYEGEKAFDTYALYELLEARPEGVVLMDDSLATIREDTTLSGNYLFVGRNAYYTEREVTQLLDYVERGNNAFLFSYNLPEDLAYHLFGDECYYDRYYDDGDRIEGRYLDTVTFKDFRGTDSLVQPVFSRRPGQYITTYHLADALLCDDQLDNEVLLTVDTGLIAGVRLAWGAGQFYYFPNPIYLTNYYLVDSSDQRLARTMLAALGPGPVFYDEASRYYPEYDDSGSASRRRNRNSQRNYTGGRNLLQGNETLLYILEQPPLALAWYTLLAAGLLFVLFRGRRRQRVIPVRLPRENSSKRFIDTISRLIYQKGNHLALARREVGSLRFYLQSRFGIRWREGDPPPENLSELTGTPPEVAERALREIRFVSSASTLGEGDLLRFFRAIEPLYQL